MKRSLTIEGLDAEALLAQVNQAQAYSQAQSQATNASLESRAVKLSGYLLPLSENDAQQVTEFLLVPYVGACIHVPPPPPNQMVYVQPDLAIDAPGVFSPVFVEGKIRQQLGDYELFRVDGSRSVKASYVMTMRAIAQQLDQVYLSYDWRNRPFKERQKEKEQELIASHCFAEPIIKHYS